MNHRIFTSIIVFILGASSGVMAQCPPGAAIITNALPAATQMAAYSQTISVNGFVTPTFSLSGGNVLPAGLSLNPATGLISGTPTGAGTFFFTVQVSEGTCTLSQSYLLNIVRDPVYNIWPQLTPKSVAADGANHDYFGNSVSISGDYAILGAPNNDNGANANQGSAYIFVRSGGNWLQQAKLTADDGVAGDAFGNSVSISGDYAIVGAYADDIGANADQGSAYIFVRSGANWAQQAKLTAADGADDDLFGSCVSISGDYAIVGASFDQVGANESQGSAYIFVRSGANWSQQAKLTAADGTAFDAFGGDVSISGDYAIVGASCDDIGANVQQGSAYIFVRSGANWTQQAKLTVPDGATYDLFGGSVSISGDYAIVGAHNNNGAYADQGSAYIFVRSGANWSQQAKLTAADGAANDSFGNSVSISGNYAIVGAFEDFVAAAVQGSAYIFVRSGANWSQQAKLTAADGATYDYFGWSVSISGDYAIVGASGFSGLGANGGQGFACFYHLASPLGVEHTPVQAAMMSIFPNPVSQITNISLDSMPAGEYELCVFDAMGRMVACPGKFNHSGNAQHSVNLSALNNGIYWLRLMDSEGHHVLSKPFQVAK